MELTAGEEGGGAGEERGCEESVGGKPGFQCWVICSIVVIPRVVLATCAVVLGGR